MIGIDEELVAELLARAAESPRLRQNFDLRSCATGGGSGVVDNSQRMLNALMPGTVVPIHRHPNSNESIILISGRAVELFYDAEGARGVALSSGSREGEFRCGGRGRRLAYDTGTRADGDFRGEGRPLWRRWK